MSTGPIQYELEFRLQLSNPEEPPHESDTALFKEVTKRFKLRNDKYTHFASTREKLHEEFLPWLLENLKSGKVQFSRSKVNETLAEDSGQVYEWYAIRERRQNEETGPLSSGYASEALREVLLKSPFASELELIWMKNNQAARPQTFLVLPKQCLGRGLDHPWFPYESAREPDPYAGGQEFNPQRRFAIWNVSKNPRNVGPLGTFFDPLMPYMLEAQHDPLFFLYSCQRFYRGAAPHAPIAYTTAASPYFRKDARAYLLESGLLKSDDFIPVLMEDAPTDGREFLDEVYGPPPEYICLRVGGDAQKWLSEKRIEGAGYEAFKAAPKASPAALLVTQLEKLKALKKIKPERFNPGLNAEMLSRENPEIPVAWRQVLAISNGIQADSFEEIYDASSIEQFTDAKQSDEHAPEHYLFIAQTMGGEFTALDLSKLKPSGDCPVLELEVDGKTVNRTWASIGEYLEALVEDIKQAAD